MAFISSATQGTFLHIYDFKVELGKIDEFIRLFNDFDYSPGNPIHKLAAQVKDGVLCQDAKDPKHFWLIGEWSDIEEHARIRKVLADEHRPAFIKHIGGGRSVPDYAKIVSSTQQDIFDKADV